MALTRRSFVKLAAATGAAASLSGAAASVALAESDTASESAGEVTRVRSCCRGCGKMECGVWVIVENGRVVRTEGDESAFQSMGNHCSKGQASLQACYHPDRLYHPMKRTNPRGADDPGWVRITWDEAMDTIAEKLQECMDRYGNETVFGMSGTSRIWGMFAYGALGQLTGSPNMAIPWQVCKGPRHWAGGMTDLFQSPWQETTGRPNVYTSWGTGPEISNYDDSCRTIVDVGEKASKHILVDPRMTNFGKEADIWLNLRPGTDCAMILGWTQYAIDQEYYDDLFVKKWTDAPFLYCADVEPDGPERYRFVRGTYQVKTRLLKESDIVEGGSKDRFLVWDNLNNRMTYFDSSTGTWEGEDWTKPTAGREANQKNLVPGVSQGFVLDPTPFNPEIDPALFGEFQVTLKDGRSVTAMPVWQKWVDYLQDYTPEAVAKITGVDADKIRKAVDTYATRVDPTTGYGNGGLHFQLAIEHACNAMNTARALELFIDIMGNFDIPGSSRGGTQADYIQKAGLGAIAPGVPNLSAEQFDKMIGSDEYPAMKWFQGWADDASIWKAIETGDPYPLKFGWCSTGDFMCMSNSLQKWRAFPNVDFFVCEDLWKTPSAGMADILLPAAHWLETDMPRLSQGAGGARGATCKAVEKPADVKYDAEIATEIFKRMGVVWGSEADPWPDYEWNLDNILEMAGTTWKEYRADFQENGWKDCKKVAPEAWGTYRRYETGMMPLKCFGDTPTVNMTIPGFGTPTRKVEIWSTILETFMPEEDAESVIMPHYEEPPLSPTANPEMCAKYPFIATTGRRIPVYFHSEHRQLPWCRELWPAPRVEINPEDAAELGIEQGDWVWIENDNGKIRQTADIYAGIGKGVVNLEHQWWFPELDQADKGFDLCSCNCLVTTGKGFQDPVTGSSYLRAYSVNIYKATPENSPFGNPVPCDHNGNEIIHAGDDPRLKAWMPDYEIREEA
ncbi:MAG: molybdopterin-dependent oxidoreductase [Eggerthellaceae bacterium]|nr:molybdopterin-dependent oxidoreductase [Eggerthellaceae bacterium]